MIEALALDLIVLTEVTDEYAPLGTTSVNSPPRRSGSGPESWVAIDGNDLVAIELPYERMAAAALATTGAHELAIYGTVLPWTHAPRHAPDLRVGEETAAEMFARVLDAQVADLLALRGEYPNASLFWIGDFNQPLGGPNSGFSNANRDRLEAALSALGMTAWNRALPDARGTGCAIDLICSTTDIPLRVTEIERFDPASLSDHAGYWIELAD